MRAMLVEMTERLDDTLQSDMAASRREPVRRPWPSAAPFAVATGSAPAWAARPASRFVRMVEAAEDVGQRRQEVLGLLLRTTLPLTCGGRPLLKPIWASEAMHRAYDMVWLVAQLEQCAPLPAQCFLAARAEHQIAAEIDATIRALDLADEHRVLPSSGLLRTLVRDLVELFGPVAGPLQFDTCIEPLLLPAYRRRALILAAGALVGNALGQRAIGGISVALRLQQPGRASLRVATDRPWPSLEEAVQPCGIVADMASLLESEPVAAAGPRGGSAVEIDFPVPVSSSRAAPGAAFRIP